MSDGLYLICWRR